MAWTDHPIGSWRAFDEKVLSEHAALTSPLKRTYIYRGQEDASWTLRPSFARLAASLDLSRKDALEIENDLKKRFEIRAHHFLETKLLPAGFGTMITTEAHLTWWSLMQHYGAATRLLDWTHSPLVALYFAVRDLWDRPGAVWSVHRRRFMEAAESTFGNNPDDIPTTWTAEAPPPRVLAFDPKRPTERMTAQQGAFTVSQDPLLDHADGIEQVIEEVTDDGNAFVLRRKYVIAPDAKRPILRQLHHMNVTAAALFPGIDGLGAELREMMRLA